jgi:hypothetical protein
MEATSLLYHVVRALLGLGIPHASVRNEAALALRIGFDALEKGRRSFRSACFVRLDSPHLHRAARGNRAAIAIIGKVERQRDSARQFQGKPALRPPHYHYERQGLVRPDLRAARRNGSVGHDLVVGDNSLQGTTNQTGSTVVFTSSSDDSMAA